MDVLKTIPYLLIVIAIYPQMAFAYTDIHPDCKKWFIQSKIKPESKDCEIQCAMLDTSMGTFMCPNQCKYLCDGKVKSTLLENLIFYPGLTPAEKALIKKYPQNILDAFVQKTRAELSSKRNFPNQDMNDESDAFRHFIWAGLLTKELGFKKAKEFLEAHEADPDQPERERIMDLHNNNRGQLVAETLIKEKNWSLRNLEAKGLNELKTNKLHVLKPGLPIPKEPQ